MELFGINLTELLMRIPAMLIVIGFHEACHGYAANALGDPTARQAGRLTLNPLAHLDPIGALCLIFFHFGWAKPVPVNAANFKRPKLGMALTALAGPVSNFVLAFVSLFAFVFCVLQGGGVFNALANFFQIMAVMSLGLGLFNLIPIPPLDGSKVLWPFLPSRWVNWLARYEVYLSIVLLIGIYFNIFTGPLNTALMWIYSRYEEIIVRVFALFW